MPYGPLLPEFLSLFVSLPISPSLLYPVLLQWDGESTMLQDRSVKYNLPNTKDDLTNDPMIVLIIKTF
jgi:hypothetical protein